METVSVCSAADRTGTFLRQMAAAAPMLEMCELWDLCSGDARDGACRAAATAAAMRACFRIFGLQPGETVEFSSATTGLSEFLSCAVAVQLLTPWLDPAQLLHVCVCIEATIPFRGQGSVTVLQHRCLAEASLLLGRQRSSTVTAETPEHGAVKRQSSATARSSSMSSDDDAVAWTQRAMWSACQMAARDVGNFAAPNTGIFLENTWLLLPEMNVALRERETSTLQAWMRALAGNVCFFSFLAAEPDRVFPFVDGCRTKDEHAGLLFRVAENLARGRAYVGTRLITSCIVHALWVAVGGKSAVPNESMATFGSSNSSSSNSSSSSSCRSSCSGSRKHSQSGSVSGDGQLAEHISAISLRSHTRDWDNLATPLDEHVLLLLKHGFRDQVLPPHLQTSRCATSSGVFHALIGAADTRVRAAKRMSDGKRQQSPRKESLAVFEECLKAALAYNKGELQPSQFLQRVPAEAVRCVASGPLCVQLHEVQHSLLQQWLDMAGGSRAGEIQLKQSTELHHHQGLFKTGQAA